MVKVSSVVNYVEIVPEKNTDKNAVKCSLSAHAGIVQ
jgi:hypothetical protein